MAVSPRPEIIQNVTYSSKSSENSLSIKTATPDIILTGDSVMSPEIMTDLIFENIGGQEIISISRSDTVSGQNVVYQPIKNISNVYYQYNPQNIIPLQGIDRDFFKNFPISLAAHIPECGSGQDYVGQEAIPNCKHVYIDPNTGDLIINVIFMQPGEQVEVQILSAGQVLNDTIY